MAPVIQTAIQIVPRRAIEPEGVGDYARLIAERLLEQHGIRTIFVTGSPLPAEQRVRDGWETHELTERSARTLAETLARIGGGAPMPVILHLSGYGYQRKGTPVWLAGGLTRWRRRNPTTPLVTVFHEIHATGPITGSAFWLAPLQRRVARRILRISSAAVTTMARYATQLGDWRQGGRPPVAVFPVFSTIGESGTDAAPARRAPILAVFGRGNLNDTIYGRDRALLEAFVVRERIAAVIDIGKRMDNVPPRIAGVPVDALGETPAAEIRLRLGTARFGMLRYNADFLAKSSIFAAYCAFGAIPVCLSDSRGVDDGVVPGENYLKLDTAAPTLLDTAPLEIGALDALQAAAYRWYIAHSLSRTVQVIYDALQAGAVAGIP